MDADRLSRCEHAAVAEEVLSVTRQQVRNKLAAIANATRYLSAKIRNTELWSADPRLERFIALIEKNVAEANEVMDSREPLDRIFPVVRQYVFVSDCVDEAVRHALGTPGRLDQEIDSTCAVEADAAELTLLISALIRHAVEEAPGDARLRLSVTLAGRDQVAIGVTVSRTGPASGERSLALVTAQRICRRYGGSIALSAAEGRATAILPAAASS